MDVNDNAVGKHGVHRGLDGRAADHGANDVLVLVAVQGGAQPSQRYGDECVRFRGAGEPFAGSLDPQVIGEFDRCITGTGLNQQRITAEAGGKGAEIGDLGLLGVSHMITCSFLVCRCLTFH
jgi:hypothetical protein